MAKLVGFAAVGGVVLAALCGWQYKANEDAQRRITLLQQQLSEKGAAQFVATKQSCSDRSQRYFTSLGYDESKADGGTFATFQNHFSARLGRCLMTLEITSYPSGRQVISKSLIDTDEHRSFGEYSWVMSDTKKYYEQKPTSCTLSPPTKPEKNCFSTDEYDEYVKEMLAS
jgi:hypothetical protein